MCLAASDRPRLLPLSLPPNRLVGCSTGFIVVGAGAYWVAMGAPWARGVDESELFGDQFGEALWQSFAMIWNAPGSSSMPGDHPNAAAALVANAIFAVGLFTFAVLLGVICDEVADKVSQVRDGNFRVLESGHTVVINWNDASKAMLQQLDQTELLDPGVYGFSKVVVLADKDKAEMEEDVDDLDLSAIRVLMRQGDPRAQSDLHSVSIETARNVVIMHQTSTATDDRTLALQLEADKAATLLQMRQLQRKAGTMPATPNVVLQSPLGAEEVADSNMCALTETTFSSVAGRRAVAHIVAEAALEDGVVNVHDELLSAAGNSIFIVDLTGELIGSSLSAAQSALENAVIIGLRRDGKMAMLPHPSAQLREGDRLVVIARSRHEALDLSSNKPKAGRGASEGSRRTAPLSFRRWRKPAHVLMLGWDGLMANVVDDIVARAPKGTQLTLCTDVKPQAFKTGTVNGSTLRHVAGEPFRYSEISKVLEKDFDAIVLLPDMKSSTSESEDSLYLSTMLCLKRFYRSTGKALPRVVGVANSEVVRDLSEELYTEMGGTRGEMLVPSVAIGSLLGQSSRTGLVDDAYEELRRSLSMQSWGASHFVEPGQTTFAQIMESAARAGHVAVGYFKEGESDVHTNPPKHEPITLSSRDSVVILTRDGVRNHG